MLFANLMIVVEVKGLLSFLFFSLLFYFFKVVESLLLYSNCNFTNLFELDHFLQDYIG